MFMTKDILTCVEQGQQNGQHAGAGTREESTAAAAAAAAEAQAQARAGMGGSEQRARCSGSSGIAHSGSASGGSTAAERHGLQPMKLLGSRYSLSSCGLPTESCSPVQLARWLPSRKSIAVAVVVATPVAIGAAPAGGGTSGAPRACSQQQHAESTTSCTIRIPLMAS